MSEDIRKKYIIHTIGSYFKVDAEDLQVECLEKLHSCGALFRNGYLQNFLDICRSLLTFGFSLENRSFSLKDSISNSKEIFTVKSVI